MRSEVMTGRRDLKGVIRSTVCICALLLALETSGLYERRQVVAARKGIAPPGDRVQVYTKNPRYIQYRGKPVFPIGCNQGWTRSLQNLDHDYEAEFDALHRVGGNLVRIRPFIGLRVDDEALFDDRPNNLP